MQVYQPFAPSELKTTGTSHSVQVPLGQPKKSGPKRTRQSFGRYSLRCWALKRPQIITLREKPSALFRQQPVHRRSTTQKSKHSLRNLLRDD